LDAYLQRKVGEEKKNGSRTNESQKKKEEEEKNKQREEEEKRKIRNGIETYMNSREFHQLFERKFRAMYSRMERSSNFKSYGKRGGERRSRERSLRK
jgi:ribosomal protein RSM22 (predicted rRNA methylase)